MHIRVCRYKVILYIMSIGENFLQNTKRKYISWNCRFGRNFRTHLVQSPTQCSFLQSISDRGQFSICQIIFFHCLPSEKSLQRSRIYHSLQAGRRREKHNTRNFVQTMEDSSQLLLYHARHNTLMLDRHSDSLGTFGRDGKLEYQQSMRQRKTSSINIPSFRVTH